MSDCCSDKACELEALKLRQASTFKIVLSINAVMFAIEFLAGLLSGSVSLVADSLDMLGDALVYGFSIFAVTRGQRAKAFSALLKGIIMAVFGLVVLGQVAYKIAVRMFLRLTLLARLGPSLLRQTAFVCRFSGAIALTTST